jgi:LysM repeat protein
MKILKIFGVVVGIHIFALILIFANPGCSSTTKPPGAEEAIAKSEPVPAPVSAPNITPAPPASSASSQPPLTFPETSTAATSSSGVRFTPTRPGSPAAATVVSEPVADVTPTTTYTVVSGDNLSKIAKKTHTTTAELAAANNLKVNATLRIGQKLLIPGKPAAPSAAASTNPPGAIAPAAKSSSSEPAAPRAASESVKHVVKSGETLGAIAHRYEVKVADIAVANNISDPAKIKPGQELIIPLPGWDTRPSTKSGKNGKAPSSSQKSGDAKSAPIEQPPATQPAPPPIIPVTPADDNPIKPAPRP